MQLCRCAHNDSFRIFVDDFNYFAYNKTEYTKDAWSFDGEMIVIWNTSLEGCNGNIQLLIIPPFLLIMLSIILDTLKVLFDLNWNVSFFFNLTLKR